MLNRDIGSNTNQYIHCKLISESKFIKLGRKLCEFYLLLICVQELHF